ncbi:uncharacterized protein DS421_16g545530 [Arachis hypogaea]|nr:uncharacterized protein DS421_16g545530 [Arachis hypogaea]
MGKSVEILDSLMLYDPTNLKEKSNLISLILGCGVEALRACEKSDLEVFRVKRKSG